MENRMILGWPHQGPAPELLGNLERCGTCGTNTWVSMTARATGPQASVGCMSCAKQLRFPVTRATIPSYGPTPEQTNELMRFLLDSLRPAQVAPSEQASQEAPVVEPSGFLASVRKKFGITVGNQTYANEDEAGEDDE